MGLPTLDQFIQRHEKKPAGFHSNEYVRKAGFEALYVRLGPRWIERVKYPCVFDIASVTARRPGAGAFTRLVEELRARGFSIYVESVLNDRFAAMLPRLGFVPVEYIEGSPSFFLLHPEAVQGIRTMEEQP
jgi:hypothetical protein